MGGLVSGIFGGSPTRGLACRAVFYLSWLWLYDLGFGVEAGWGKLFAQAGWAPGRGMMGAFGMLTEWTTTQLGKRIDQVERETDVVSEL